MPRRSASATQLWAASRRVPGRVARAGALRWSRMGRNELMVGTMGGAPVLGVTFILICRVRYLRTLGQEAPADPHVGGFLRAASARPGPPSPQRVRPRPHGVRQPPATGPPRPPSPPVLGPRPPPPAPRPPGVFPCPPGPVRGRPPGPRGLVRRTRRPAGAPSWRRPYPNPVKSRPMKQRRQCLVQLNISIQRLVGRRRRRGLTHRRETFLTQF